MPYIDMGLSEWTSRTQQRFKTEGVREAFTESGYELYSGLWRLGRLFPIPTTNIYERDWDVLVILDGCRVDVLKEVADEYPFIREVNSISSVGSMSIEWMENTFDRAEYGTEMGRTSYVTANIFSDNYLDASGLQHLDEVWRYGWDEELNTIPPREVTDSAIRVSRSMAPGRLIVHYMQPHHPFIADKDMQRFDVDPFGRENTGEGEHTTAWDALRRGLVSREKVWNAYKENLRLVLDEVDILRNNIDADTLVLSADHGNAVGEWGIYDHPIGFPHPAVKRVPWVETTASNSGEYSPEVTEGEETVPEVESRLEALGYK
jgi:hypothetical protein